MEGNKVSFSDSEDFFYYQNSHANDENESEREDPDRQHLDSDVSIRELEDGDIEVSQQLIATDPTVRCINNLLGKVNLQRMVVPLKAQELVVQEN